MLKKRQKTRVSRPGLYLLASKCKTKQNKDGKDEILEAAKLFLKFAKNDPVNPRYTYQCAAKCFLKVGQYDFATKAFEESKKYILNVTEEKRPIVVVDDSPAITQTNYFQQLGYDDIRTVSDGKEAIKLITKLIKGSQNPIILLDMELPGTTGDVIAYQLL